MTTNPYINNFARQSEKDLYNALNVESIQMHGIDLIYLPREFRKLDLVYGEDVLSRFAQSFPIEMYLKSVPGFEGDKDFLTKFGIEVRDEATFTVSISRFNTVLSGVRTRPNEGDLIYFPFNRAIFEIRFVENHSVFYQVGELFVYDIKVSPYEYSHEEFATGNVNIDRISKENANTITLVFGAGSGIYLEDNVIYQGASLGAATAKATVLSWDALNKKALVTKVVGQFVTGTNVTNGSGATYALSSIDEFTMPKDPLDNSGVFDIESDLYIDFTEDNPFGEDI